jgi:nucleoside-diphosphate-sugar epimerase
MKIVVTGGSGKLGQQVISELGAHGHDVVSLDRAPHPDAVPSQTADLRNAESLQDACAGADGIIHLAAHIAPNIVSDFATFNDNVSMTYNALKAASEAGLRRAVVASSISAYGFLYGPSGMTPAYLPVDEEHPCHPVDPYGLSKVVGETIADSFTRRDGSTIVSLRFPGINYDPAFERIKKLMIDPGFRRSGFWSYIDVHDAAIACRLAIESNLNGHHVFNAAAPTSNMREPTRELVERFFPDLKDIRNRGDKNWSGIDSTKAERDLGFRAKFVWEHVIAR